MFAEGRAETQTTASALPPKQRDLTNETTRRTEQRENKPSPPFVIVNSFQSGALNGTPKFRRRTMRRSETGVPDEGAREPIIAINGAGYSHVGEEIADGEIGRTHHKNPPHFDGQAPNHIQFMRSADQRPDRVLFKAYRVDGERYIKSPLHLPYLVQTFAREANDIRSAMDAIYDVACDRESCMVLGGLRLDDERVAKILREGVGIRRRKRSGAGSSRFNRASSALFHDRLRPE